MPYENGGIPKIGDKVKSVNSGRLGVITSVHLNQGHLRGEDAVAVEWDDGGVGVGNALAVEFFHVETPDGYQFLIQCPSCKQRRSVSCNKKQAMSGEAVRVAAI